MKVKKYLVGAFVGVLGAVGNIIFLMMASGIEGSVYISTSLTWIAVGVLISESDFKLLGAVKGAIVALLVSASSLVFVFLNSISGGMWTVLITIVIGAIMGFVIDLFVKRNSTTCQKN